ncbi:MAG: porin family protein [Bdellovibrionota bacterium]
MKYLLLLLLSLAPTLSHAEDRLGVIAGVNFAKVRGVGNAVDWQSYFLPGVYADFGLSEDLFLTPQIRYTRKGWSYSQSYLFDSNFAIKYLEVPLYVKYKFPGGNNFRPNLFIGPSFAAKIGDSFTSTNQVTGVKTTTRNQANDLRSYDLAAEAGVGVEFMLSTDMVGSLNIAYSHGLVDLLPNDAANIKSQGIQVYAGFGF